MVVNIRGTSGAGKTHLVRSLMALGECTPLGDNPKKPDAYHCTIPSLTKPLFVIGSYENVCGGCDGIKTQDEICDRVRMWAPHGHVIYEGLLMGLTFARYAALDCELAVSDVHCVWGFLDTPLDVCLERVRQRREERRLAKANPSEFKELDVTNTSAKWHAANAVFDKFIHPKQANWKGVAYPPTKLDARWIPYQTATETVLGWLKDA